MGIRFDRGILLFEHRRYAAALEEFAEELAAFPNSAPTHAMVSLCLMNLRRYKEARRAAETAIGSDPSYDWGHYALAWSFYGDMRFSSRRGGDIPLARLVNDVPAHRYRFAASAVSEALRLSPHKVDLFILKSMISFDSLRPREALEAANAGLAIAPGSAGCQRMRALVLRKFGDLAGAQAASAQALVSEPDSAASHASAGWAALYAQQFDKAREHFIEALRIDPTFAGVRGGLARAFRASFAFYRPLWWVACKFIVLQRTRGLRWIAWAIIVAMIVLFTVLGDRWKVDFDNYLDGLLASLLIACGMLYALHCLANYLLLFDPLGRLVLRRRERFNAINGVSLAVTILIAVGLHYAVRNWEWTEISGATVVLFCCIYLSVLAPVLIRARRSLFRHNG